MPDPYIAVVRNKQDGEVHYLKTYSRTFRSWTGDIDHALQFQAKKNAENALTQTRDGLYEKFVGTKSEVRNWVNGLKFIAAARTKETGKVRYRVAHRYPHLGPGEVWSEKIEDAHRFDTVEEAERVISLMSNASYEKKVGTPSQVQFWANQVDMKKLQDTVNASVKKIADVAMAPALFVPTDQVGSMVLGQDFDIKFDEVETPEANHTAGSNDLTSLDIIETYIEKAQKIEEEGADEYTWRGFLHAFLKDVLEAGK